ncbi:DUF2304 domain-containing protein [Corynebacterium genitalium ATCC 33030]|uniref:DUF2304 domain-containing protein n=1 Tax=Corynebacterium genitalium ATCC 33030 TaxID=585529 RepID=D7WBA1_9CORY|nr:DUF2304 domain-containing protein [Corynebacterium genitalium]EFK55132.1 hypothetical protein HMPREF0291_10390 [Corynebacterium genitalium ATCC 33030]UUA89602.1 DUF2304 domain-containing protein [Corynebacterium genitalium ATCC 33030]
MIQFILLIAAVVLAVYFFTQRKKAFAKAWVKVGFALLAIAAVWAILRPDDVTIVANWLGVDRGTDLMLYVMIIAFFFTTMSTWVRFREQELRYARLARAVALQNAVPPMLIDAPTNPSQTPPPGNSRDGLD